eukprot:c8007_g1_i1.p1 GENE.c8007_g1_i1~~c8007_g1_i1.p1  ORF type:complete len:284 (+),score=124.53 c8007_g1_i1:91-852(+)
MSDEVYNRLVGDALEKNKTITVTFFRHLNKSDKGKQYIWNLHHQFKTFEQMRIQLASDVSGSTGPVQRVYDVEGNKITELSQLQDKHFYICCGGEAFTKAGIPTAAAAPETPAAAAAKKPDLPKASEGGETQDPEGRVISKEEAEQMIDKDIKAQKTKVCYFYGANGQCQKTDKGARFVINPTRYKTLEQLISEVSSKVRLITGGIQKIYDLEGNELTSVADLTEQGRYVCSIARSFNKSMIPEVALATDPPK